MLNYKTLLILVLVINYSCFNSKAQNYSSFKYDTHYGLPTNHITCFTIDQYGTYWFGSDKGIIKWGAKFESFGINDGLADNHVSAIATDRNNNIWIGTLHYGLSKFDGKNFFNRMYINNGLSDKTIQSLYYYIKDDLLFIQTTNKLLVIKNDTLHDLNIKIDQTSSVQYVENDTLLYIVKNKNERYLFDQVLNSLIRSEKGNTEYNEGLLSKNGESNKLNKDFAFINDYCKTNGFQATFISFDKTDHAYMIGTTNNGIIVIPISNFHYISLPNKIKGNINPMIIKESTDSIIIPGQTFYSIKLLNNTDNKINQQTFFRDLNTQILTGNKNYIIIKKSDQYYAVNLHSRKRIKLKSADQSISFFYIDNNQYLYYKINQHLIIQDLSKHSIIHRIPFPHKIEQIITTSKGCIILTNKNELFRYSIEKEKTLHIALKSKDIKSPVTRIHKIDDSSFIIIDNEGNITECHFEGEALKTKIVLPSPNIFTDKTILFSLTDASQSIWFGTEQFLHRLILEKDNYSYQTWGENEGYNVREAKDAMELNSRQIIILDSDKLTLFDPHEISTEIRKPLILLTKANNKEYNLNVSYINRDIITEKNKSKIGYKIRFSNRIVVFYIEPKNIIGKEQIMFRYKLTPDKNGWSPFSKHPYLYFNDLKSGNYNLKIQACFDYNPNQLQTFEYAFFITPPWYNSVYAYSFYGVCSFILFLLIFFNRHKYSRKRKETEMMSRERTALLKMEALQSQMNPHFIFNAMNSLQYSILENNTDKALEFIGEFSNLIRNTLDNASQQFITLKEEINYIENYLRVEQMRYVKNIQYSIDISEGIDQGKYKIPPMLIQPHVENAIKYSISSNISYIIISVSKVQDKLICMIEDNGIGRTQSSKIKKEHQSKGQKITKERFDLLNFFYNKNNEYRFEIEDLYDSEKKPTGTRITLFFPVVTEY